MNWMQIQINCSSADLSKVKAVASMLDPHIMVEDYRDVREGLNAVYGELIDEELLRRADEAHARVSIYVDETKNYTEYLAFLNERFSALEIEVDIKLFSVQDDDWENNWKQYYKPIKVGNRLVIVPAWEEYQPAEDEVIVTMDPGMAFGSGTHETTRLCASLIDTYMAPNSRVLDVGTGSGILAIAESKLGASHVCACDLDPNAVRVAAENAALNNAENIDFFVSDLLSGVSVEDGMFDFVSANIVSDIIIRMAPDLPAVMKLGGRVVLSGIIEKYAMRVIRTMEKCGFTLSDIISENDWRGMLFVRTK